MRLLREARAAARLDHPSIVKVYDFGSTQHGDPFIVMEVVRGESLADLFERHARMSALSAVQLLLPIASALAAAHDRGIVHRDIKPENIILMNTEQGAVVPKLVDFGIAKVVDDAGGRRLTREGSVLGTPDYMSPEQVRATGDINERADIWAFSVVLYETIVGRLPFEGPTVASVFGAILADAPTPIIELGAGDVELWDILAKGLSKAPEERWQHMRSLGRELARWALARGSQSDSSGASIERAWFNEGEAKPFVIVPSSTPPSLVQPSATRWLKIGAAAVGALVVVGGLTWASGDDLGALSRETRLRQVEPLRAAALAPTATARVSASAPPAASTAKPKATPHRAKPRAAPQPRPRRKRVVPNDAILPGF